MCELFESTEFWTGIIGAIIGGCISIIAVYLTMAFQRKLDQEQRRIDKMPLLQITVEKKSFEDLENGDYSFLGISGNELLTSANPEPNVKYSCISVTPKMNAVFNFRISEVYMSPFGVLEKTAAFAPMAIRLLPEEVEKTVFHCLDEVRDNRDVAIRYAYQDLFGNGYVQDVIFQYFETDYDGRSKVLELREILQPQLITRKAGARKEKRMNVKTLEKALKDL